ncbi:MAG TPA: hypothetical protein VGH45_10460 [Solirubrobacteraceae bacterium]
MRRLTLWLAVTGLAAVMAPAASASISPTLKLTPSSGSAGSTANLGMDLKFSPTATDSPKDLTLVLPPGLLADATIDSGRCLSATAPTASCQVGTGTVTATEILLGLPTVSTSVPVAFDLVQPPAPGDLAGLAIVSTNPLIDGGGEIGTPGAITVRSGSDPRGVGLNIAFANIPTTASLAGLPTTIAVDEINSTFNGLRFPTACPQAPARLSAVADSYSVPATKTTSAPLKVTGCRSLPFDPRFGITAAKDASDNGVAIQTDITQKPDEATSQKVVLNLPATVLMPNATGVLSGGILCGDPTFATCKTVGSATAASPLYPTPLVGKAYLDGPLTSLSIALVFPPPFALTLVGKVDLPANSTTFEHVPDIPLTDLRVNLAGGPSAVFSSACSPASGTAGSVLTSQNGDKTASPSASFTVANCTGSGTGGGPTPPGGSPPGTTTHPGGTGPPGGATTPSGSKPRIRPKLTAGSWTGLKTGRPTLKFKLSAGRGAPKLAAFTVRLPRGISFARRRLRKGLALRTAPVRSVSLQRGALLVRLRRDVSSLGVTIGPRSVKESAAVESRARAKRHRLRSLRLVVGVQNADRQTFALTLAIKNLHLGR